MKEVLDIFLSLVLPCLSPVAAFREGTALGCTLPLCAPRDEVAKGHDDTKGHKSSV
jgi:hypothetical protein